MSSGIGTPAFWGENVWRKSSFSGPHGSCVELAPISHGRVGIRNTRDREGLVLTCTRTEFAALLRGAKEGCFDSFML